MSRIVGICVGAVTLSLAEETDGRMSFERVAHNGKVAQALKTLLKDRQGVQVGVTGQKFRKSVPYPSIGEPEAVEFAFRHIRGQYPDIDTIISAGGESFLAYSIDGEGRVRSTASTGCRRSMSRIRSMSSISGPGEWRCGPG